MKKSNPRYISSRTLLEAARGIEPAVSVLVDFIYGRTAAILGAGSSILDDVVQDSFMSILNAVRIGNFDSEKAEASPWVSTIVIRKAIDARRAELRHALKFDPLGNFDDVTDPEANDLHSRLETEEQIRHILDKMDPDEVGLLFLRYIDELSIDELSAYFSVPVGTIKSRLHRITLRFAKQRTQARPRGVG